MSEGGGDCLVSAGKREIFEEEPPSGIREGYNLLPYPIEGGGLLGETILLVLWLGGEDILWRGLRLE